jgi:hypothetical protein
MQVKLLGVSVNLAASWVRRVREPLASSHIRKRVLVVSMSILTIALKGNFQP